MPRNYVLHPKLRIRGMRTRHAYRKELTVKAWHCVILTALCLGLLFVLNTSVLSSAVAKEQEIRKEVEAVIISCLNHGAAYFNNSLHLCKPQNVWLEKGKDLN